MMLFFRQMSTNICLIDNKVLSNGRLNVDFSHQQLF
jgi:hypothetical protein